MLKDWRIKLLLHKNKIMAIGEIAKSIANFALTKSKFSLISGGIDGLELICNMDRTNPYTLFNSATGWETIFDYAPLHDMFQSVIAKLPSELLEFSFQPARLYKVNNIEFVVIYDHYPPYLITILCRPKDKTKLITFLVEEKLKELNSQCFMLSESSSEQEKLLLSSVELRPVESEKSKYFASELNRAFEQNINRSLLLLGLPGVGKTTLAHTIIKHFNFKAIKFRPMKQMPLSSLVECIKYFNVDAIILDDFDQIEASDDILLEFLEVMNHKVKLIIGISNSLSVFDPAILRPGRFDEIVKIDTLEDSSIKSVLKDLDKIYHNKVKSWPIAYVKELHKQSVLNPKLLGSKFEELHLRVEELKKSYEKISETDDNVK